MKSIVLSLIVASGLMANEIQIDRDNFIYNDIKIGVSYQGYMEKNLFSYNIGTHHEFFNRYRKHDYYVETNFEYMDSPKGYYDLYTVSIGGGLKYQIDRTFTLIGGVNGNITWWSEDNYLSLSPKIGVEINDEFSINYLLRQSYNGNNYDTVSIEYRW